MYYHKNYDSNQLLVVLVYVIKLLLTFLQEYSEILVLEGYSEILVSLCFFIKAILALFFPLRLF